MDSFYLLLADLVLVVHFAFVAVVVGGFLAIVCGKLLSWQWIYYRPFRLGHLVAIGVVVLQAWLGQLCPLTILESSLRRAAGQSGYSETFIQHWLHRILYYQAEPWVFTLVYSVFGGLVLLFWILDRNRRPGG